VFGGCAFDVLHGETGVHPTDTENRHDAFIGLVNLL
jgi:hypothetical protein